MVYDDACAAWSPNAIVVAYHDLLPAHLSVGFDWGSIFYLISTSSVKARDEERCLTGWKENRDLPMM